MKAAGALGAAALLASLLLLERRRPLRRRVAPEPRRLARNLAAGAAAAGVVALAQAPVTRWLTHEVERRRLGLVQRLDLPPLVRRVLALLLLDYTLYLWHVLLHRSDTLWRWHRFHHADPDLDTSTALRFHAMELLWSVPWRAAQVALIGVDAGTLSLWSQLTAAEVLFHHSNLRLSPALERAIGLLLVTPAQHGLHHADVQALQQANFSSGLSLWDRLHGTCAPQVPQDRITIGVPPPQAPR